MYLKKFYSVFLIGILFCFCTLSACQYSTTSTQMELDQYCGQIYTLIGKKNFDEALLHDGSIRLYSQDDTLIETIPFKEYDKKLSRKIVRIQKDEFAVYFILGGIVDDQFGIMYVSDDANHALHRISVLEHLGGCLFKYSR